MESKNEEYKNIPGRGMDSDPDNKPTYPMKHYTGDDHNRINYERSEQQKQDVEILMSNERPTVTRVFGTSVPPSGMSGMIRRYAFKHSEDRYRHWIPLIFADRINVVEGVIEDILNGHIPNSFSERGLKMEMKHNPAGFARKVALNAVLAIVIYKLLTRKKN